MKKYDVALFDLDGTVSQSALGIRLCIQKTLDKMNKPHPDLSDYSKFIGPPLVHTFRDLCGLSESEAQTAVEIYVDFYDVYGVSANVLYDGMAQTLAKLKENGVQLAICSSKHESVANSVVDMLGVRDAFDAVCGSTVDGTRKEKEDLIPYALNTLGYCGNSIVMIGDTKFDAIGAEKCGVDFIGVEYGYGNVDEMISCGCTMLAKSPRDIIGYILGDSQ